MKHLKFYSGLFLMASCTLMLQIIQTRILSVVVWYHMAFFAISMAMFGMTAGAAWVFLKSDRFTEQTLSYDLSYFSTVFSVSTVVCLMVQLTLVPFSTMTVTSIFIWFELAVCMAIPFYFSGIVISLALTRSSFPIGKVYGADLFGAAVGCFGVLFVLNSTDGPSAILWVAALAAVGSIFFHGAGIGGEPDPKPLFSSLFSRRTALALSITILALANGLIDNGLQPIAVKGRFESNTRHLFREWNTFSRVAVYPTYLGVPQMWGPSPEMPPVKVEQRYMNIDGDACTNAYRFSGNLKEEAAFTGYDVTNMAYFLPGRNKAAIIGVGGGRDILAAAFFDCQDITGIEINPIFLRLLDSEPRFTDLHKLKGVSLVLDEARSWFARTTQTFDLIQMSLIDTWAATGAGAFSLSENGLYTLEAWKIFLSRLKTGGVFTVSRWYNPKAPHETGRMLSLAVASLMDLGVKDPGRQVFLVAQDRIATIIVSRTPFSSGDIEILEEQARLYKHTVLISPTMEPSSEVLQRIMQTRSRQDLDRYTSSLDFDLTPPTDNRPFFFNQLPVNKPAFAFRLYAKARGQGVLSGNIVATVTLMVVLCVSVFLVFAAIIVPLRPAVADVGRSVGHGRHPVFPADRHGLHVWWRSV